MSRKGGTWGTYVSRLRTGGLIEQDATGRYACTPAGRDRAGTSLPPPPSPVELRSTWGASLGGGPARMLALLAGYPDGLTRADLADHLQMVGTGGTFGTYLSRLRSNDLIVEAAGTIRLVPELMDTHGIEGGGA